MKSQCLGSMLESTHKVPFDSHPFPVVLLRMHHTLRPSHLWPLPLSTLCQLRPRRIHNHRLAIVMFMRELLRTRTAIMIDIHRPAKHTGQTRKTNAYEAQQPTSEPVEHIPSAWAIAIYRTQGREGLSEIGSSTKSRFETS